MNRFIYSPFSYLLWCLLGTTTLKAQLLSPATEVRATKIYSSIKVTFKHPNVSPNKSFLIYRSTHATFDSAKPVSYLRDNRFLDTDPALVPETRYYYWVREVNHTTKQKSRESILDDYGKIVSNPNAGFLPPTSEEHDKQIREALARQAEEQKIREALAKSKAQANDPQDLMPYGTASQGVKKALVIGIGNYQYLDSLAEPLNDARIIADLLRAHGWGVMGRENLQSRASFVKTIGDFNAQLKLKASDTLLIYYSGHALHYNNRTYLVPKMAKIQQTSQIETQAFPLDSLIEPLAKQCKVRIVFLDACRSRNISPAPHLASVLSKVQLNENEYVTQLDQQNAGETLLTYSTVPPAAPRLLSPLTEALYGILSSDPCIPLDQALEQAQNQIPKTRTPIWKTSSTLSTDNKVAVKNCD